MNEITIVIPETGELSAIFILFIVLVFAVLFPFVHRARVLLHKRKIILYNEDGWDKKLSSFQEWKMFNQEDRTPGIFIGVFGPLIFGIVILLMFIGYAIYKLWPLTSL